MHLKDILFAIANFLILFGALFFITHKMISRMFRERKEKLAGELDKAKKAEESAAALENQVNRDNELARQQEKQLLEDTKRQVEKNRVCAAGDSQAAANVLRQSAAERERQLRAIMHEEVSTQVVRQVAEETGISKDVSDIVLPMGATMHMDGSAMSAIIKVAFLFGMFGQDFTTGRAILAIIVAVFSSVAMSGIPGGGGTGELVLC